MAGLVPAIHAFCDRAKQGVDARPKAGHDERLIRLPLARKLRRGQHGHTRLLARQGQQHAHGIGERNHRGAAIRDERQRHALGRNEMQVHRHVDGRLHAEQNGQASGGETREGVFAVHGARQRADHDKGIKRHQRQTERDAEFLRRHREHEVGMALGQQPLDRALARTAAEPAAAHEAFSRDVDVESVAGRRIEEFLDAGRHMRHREIGGGQPDAGDAGDAEHPDQPHAGHEEQRAPHQHDQHGLAEIRLDHQQRHHQQQQQQREGVGRHVGALGQFAEQPGDQDDEGGLEEFRGLDVDAEDDQPAPRALDLGAEIGRRRHHDQADREHDQRQPPDLARVEERHPQKDGDGRDQIEDMPVDEIERVEPEPAGDRRRGGEREHDARQHQRADGGERQPVDRPPPFGERRALRARNHVPFPATS